MEIACLLSVGLLQWLRRGVGYIFMCMYGYEVPLHVLVLYMVCLLSQDRRIDGEIQKSREKCELGIFHGVAMDRPLIEIGKSESHSTTYISAFEGL
jgi:hypothetical protein